MLPAAWRAAIAAGISPRSACAHAPSGARSSQPPPGTSSRSGRSDRAPLRADDGAVVGAHGARALERDEARADVVADGREAGEDLPRADRVELVEAVEEEDLGVHGAQRRSAAPVASSGRKATVAIDSCHASRRRARRQRGRRVRPRDPGAGVRPRAAAVRLGGLRAGGGPGADRDRLRRGRPARAGGARRARTPSSCPGSATARGRCRTEPLAALRAAARARRPHRVDLHGRVRARRRGPARRPPRHDALALRGPARARVPGRHVDPDVLYVDEGDVLTSAGRRGGHGPVPAHGPRRPRRRGGQRGRAAHGRRRPPRRRPGAVRRAPAARPRPAAAWRRRARGWRSGCPSR